jgi:hypothetical protein
MPFSMQALLIGGPGGVLRTKFNILGKPDVPVSQTGRSDFYSYKIVNIFKWRLALYISQVGYTSMFLGYACVSRTIWLNFTQETKKCLRQQ